MDARQPDRPRPVHALQRLHRAPAPSRRSTSATRSTSTSARGHRDCVRACGAAGAIDFERARDAQSEPLRPRARPAARAPQIALHQPPQGYFHAADDARRVARRAELRDSGRRVREAEVLRLQAEDLRAQPHAARSAAPPASTSARRRRSRARPGDQRHRRRAAPVRRLRRLHHGVPERRAELRLPARARPRRAHPHAARDLRGGRRTRRGAADAQRDAGARDRGARPRRAHRRGCTACRRASCRSTSGTRASVGIDLWLAAIALRREPGRGCSCTDEEAPAVPRGARARRWRVAQAILNGARLRGEHFRCVDAARAASCRARRARCGSSAGRALPRARIAGARFARRQPTSGRRSTSRSSICCAHAPMPADAIALPARARPFGAIASTATPARCAWPASAPAPKARCSTTPTRRSSLHREELRAVRPVREHLSRGRDPLVPRPRSPTPARRAAAARAQRGAIVLAAFAAASRSARSSAIEAMIAQAGRPLDVPGRRARSSGCRCAATAASIDLHSEPRRSGHPTL